MDTDPGWKNPNPGSRMENYRSAMEKSGPGIQDKLPGSTTLLITAFSLFRFMMKAIIFFHPVSIKSITSLTIECGCNDTGDNGLKFNNLNLQKTNVADTVNF